MAKWIATGLPVIFLSTGVASIAQADVSPADVWQNWQTMSQNFGQTLTAQSETAAGNSLTLSGITIEVPVEDGVVTGNIGEIVLNDRGDGTVGVTISEDYTLNVATEASSGETADIAIRITQDALDIIASGTPDAVDYDYTADQLGIVIDGVTVEGETFEVVGNFLFNGLVGAYRVGGSDGREMTSDATAAEATFDLSVLEPDGNGSFKMNAGFETIETTSRGMLPGMMAMTDMAALMEAGFASEGAFSHGPAQYAIAFSDDAENFNLNVTMTGGGVDIAMSNDLGLRYGVESAGLAVVASGSEIPLPQVNFAADETRSEFLFPVVPKEEADPVGLLVRLVGVTMGEQIWSLFDPAGALPRDPATLIVDLSGQARVLMDIFSADESAEGPPGELETLSLDQLLLTIIGAELTGTGAFEFDNSAPGPVPGMPNMTGAVDLQLVGGQSLIDKLVQLGMLPEDQAMGARMMLGLFARPGEGEDTLVSKIEVAPDGSILANGQRIN